MLRLFFFPRRSAGLIVAVPLAILFTTGCSDDSSVPSPDAAAPGEGGSSAIGTGSDAAGTDSSNAGSADGGPTDGGHDASLLPMGDAAAGGATDSGRDASADSGDAGSNPVPLGPAPVNLGSTTDPASAGSYVLLAKTGITNVTGSSITGGNLGLSPAAASFITGFSLIADSTNVFSTSASVVAPGKVYASDFAPPTPTNLTTAILNMQTAYTDAAGRSNPDALNLNGGNLGGLTLAPGLYTWGTGVTVPSDLTLSGGVNDVWILQIANDLDVSSAKNIVLSGGARAKNVFWQVAGQATIHANAHFEGIILSQTAITLQTTASMNGRALAQSLVALDNDAITAP